MDRYLKPRLETLVSDGGIKAVAALCILLASLMPPLEIVPFAAILPALAIAIMAVGLSAKVGVVLIIGFIIAVIGIGTALYFLM